MKDTKRKKELKKNVVKNMTHEEHNDMFLKRNK